jgi:hypothetical protein
MGQDYNGMQQGAMKPEIKETITNLGLEYGLMTQFTSFVAVEEMIVTDGGQPRRIDVPVEVPEGVNRASAFADEGDVVRVASGNTKSLMMLSPGTASAVNYSVSEVVTVSGLAGTVDTSSSSVTSTFGGSLIDPAAANTTSASKPKQARAKNGSGGGGGAGTGGGSGAGNAGNVAAFELKEAETPVIPAPEQVKRRNLITKLHPSLLAVVDRLKNQDARAAPEEAKFIRDGKAEVQIWLTDKSAETLAKLKELGFEVVLDPKSAKLIIGRVAIEKLAALTELSSVRYVAPSVRQN